MGGVLGIMLSNQTVLSVTATGGNYIYDGTGSYVGYRFHVFTSPGTFTVTSNPTNKTFDAVIVGGGGGSGIASATADGGGGAGGGAITEVTGLSLTTNTGYPATVGAGGTLPAPAPLNAGQTSSWNGYTAAGGSTTGQPGYRGPGTGGASGNGNVGGKNNQAGIGPVSDGGGGGGAGGAGNDSRYWTKNAPPLLPAYIPYYGPKGYPTPYAAYFGTGNNMGGGGRGLTSSIDGITYGAGGGGGSTNNPTYTNYYYSPEANVSDTVGLDFVPGGGGRANNPGANGKGGGAGGASASPTGVFLSGGSGTVVIRYAYGVPGTPTITSVAPNGSGQAIVSFTAPSATGSGPITSYTVVSSPGGITATGSTSPITITGLTNGTSYTFTVYATNSVGNGSSSASSSPFTPYPSVAASGGQLTYDLRGYRYHVFTSAGHPAPGQPTAVGAAGSFVITSNLGNKLFDVMCVGGGGGGGIAGSYSSGAGGGGGGAVVDYLNIPITMPAPGAPVSLPVYVGLGLGLGISTSDGAVSRGGLEGPGGFGGTYPVPIRAQFNSRFGATPLGYTANAGQCSGQISYEYSQFPLYPAGASGNGNAGGSHPAFPAGGDANVQVGGAGGGGAGGTGYFGSPLWPVPAPINNAYPGKYFPTSSPQLTGGAGGIGFTSSIAQSDSPHGNVFGGGGGGGVGVGTPAPTSLGGTGGPGGGGPGGSFSSYSGPGYRGFDGATNTGGGGGGIAGGSNGPYAFGGPGIVVVRYPYP
jgi:hypothetical protein